tara:strand:- start:1282 stop:1491 length:210 start_codon:yes stop_codon:yes gene_type:complete
MIEMVNDVVLLPYTLFNYMFSLAVWAILTIYTINWIYENNASDWFQYRFNRFMDNCHDFFLKFKFWGKK